MKMHWARGLAMLAVVLGSVHLPHAVKANGADLPAGTYQIRLTDETPAPAAGQSPDAERWVEFLQRGKVIGREVASVIPAADMGAIAKSARPKPNAILVETLRGGDYLRVWINKNGINYLINLPTGK